MPKAPTGLYALMPGDESGRVVLKHPAVSGVSDTSIIRGLYLHKSIESCMTKYWLGLSLLRGEPITESPADILDAMPSMMSLTTLLIYTKREE